MSSPVRLYMYVKALCHLSELGRAGGVRSEESAAVHVFIGIGIGIGIGIRIGIGIGISALPSTCSSLAGLAGFWPPPARPSCVARPTCAAASSAPTWWGGLGW